MKLILSGLAAITLLFSTLLPQQSWATGCGSTGIFLYKQTQVDDFESAYPGCTSVTGELFITSDISSIPPGDKINNLDGLANLVSVGGPMSIQNNVALTNMDGLAGLASVGGRIFIQNNAALTDLDGLAKLTSLGGGLEIYDNAALTGLNGLYGLTSIGGNLIMINNPVLSGLDGLGNLTSIGGDFLIYSNAVLSNLNGLGNLTNVDGSLAIYDNATLTDLDGLVNLNSVGTDTFLQNNLSLAKCTGLSVLLDTIDDGIPGPGPGLGGIPDVGGDVTILDNASGCNSIRETILHYAQIPTIDHFGLTILVLLTLVTGFGWLQAKNK